MIWPVSEWTQARIDTIVKLAKARTKPIRCQTTLLHPPPLCYKNPPPCIFYPSLPATASANRCDQQTYGSWQVILRNTNPNAAAGKRRVATRWMSRGSVIRLVRANQVHNRFKHCLHAALVRRAWHAYLIRSTTAPVGHKNMFLTNVFYMKRLPTRELLLQQPRAGAGRREEFYENRL